MKKYVKLIFIIVILCFSTILLSNSSYAATSSLSVNSSSATIGDTITITVAINAAQWNLTLTANGEVLNTWRETNNFSENLSNTFTASYKTTEAGTVEFRLEGDITDVSQDNIIINTSKTVTVKEKETSGGETSEEKPSDDNKPSGGNTETGGSSSGGGNSSSENNNSESSSSNEPSFREVNETVYSTGSINVRESYSTSSSILGSLSEGQSIKRTGIGSNGWSRVSYNGRTAYISSSLLTTTKPEEKEDKPSDNNDLASLTIEGITLSPTFDKNVTEYTASVGEEIANLIVNAVAENNKATVEISGDKDLQMGENTVTIAVTSEEGKTKTYTIRVTKGEVVSTDDTLKLQNLEIAGVNFDGQFNPDTYSYELNLNRYVNNLDITAVANKEDANIEIIGNENLVEGENTITILLTSSDGEETVTYQIKAIIPVATTNVTQNNTQFYMICAGIAIAVIIIVIIVIIVYKKRKNAYIEEDDDEIDYGAFQPKFEPNKQEDEIKDELDSDDKKGEKEITKTTKNKDAVLDDFLNNNEEEAEIKPKRPRGKHSV